MNILVRSFRFILTPMLLVYVDSSSSAGTVFKRQKLTCFDVRFTCLDVRFYVLRRFRRWKGKSTISVRTKHLYNICTTSAQRLWRWSNIVHWLLGLGQYCQFNYTTLIVELVVPYPDPFFRWWPWTKPVVCPVGIPWPCPPGLPLMECLLQDLVE